MPTKSELASAANLHCPILSLSNEIITSIVYLLHPREAIFLSLTCRALYHGVLSDQNQFLWYKVGRFAESMPGHKAGWMLGKRLDQIMKGPATKQLPPVNNNSDSNVDATASAADKGKKRATSKKPTRKDLVTAARVYSPGEVVVNYKKMLVDTMLGDTDTGCQWCLTKPMTRKIYESWKLRLCEWCFYENVITKHACKPLGIDISHLPVQDVKRQGGVLHGVWKLAVERLADEKYGDTKPVLERLEWLNNEKQAEMDAASEGLAVYREKHFVVIFEEIQRQYQELYERHEKMGFTETFGCILKKITPERLKLEWFMEPRRDGKYISHPKKQWMNFNKKDLLMKELKSIKAKGKWDDAAWVQEKAREKIANMQKLLSVQYAHRRACWNTVCDYWDIPSLYMRDEVDAIAKEWHMKRAIEGGVDEFEGGVDEFVKKVVAQNGQGFPCPWAHRSLFGFQPSETLEDFIMHLRIFHWDIFMLGDTDWLVGRPSRWWVQNAVRNGVLGATDEDRKYGTAYFSQAIQQTRWLQIWWPDRWKKENVQVLQGWMDNGGFYGTQYL